MADNDKPAFELQPLDGFHINKQTLIQAVTSIQQRTFDEDIEFLERVNSTTFIKRKLRLVL